MHFKSRSPYRAVEFQPLEATYETLLSGVFEAFIFFHTQFDERIDCDSFHDVEEDEDEEEICEVEGPSLTESERVP